MHRLSARHEAVRLLLLLSIGVLTGCASSLRQAPVEDRSPHGVRAPLPTPAPAATPGSGPTPLPGSTPAIQGSGDPSLKPGSENAGKPGYYTIKPGDTLMRVGAETGQNWRDIARWNGIDNPGMIEVGQVLRVVPPGADASAPSTKGIASTRLEARPLDAKPSPSAASGPAPGPSALPPMPALPTPTSPAPAAAAPVPAPVAPAGTGGAAARGAEPDEDIVWAWPAAGPVTRGFDDVTSKGLSITGKVGDPVLAAADGRVVYAGSGLRGYGNLVILKHNNTYLTAYAHNKTLLVKEDQVIRRGQKIAEMGSSDADRVNLHFEIRRQGKPIDPVRLLPPR
jgi:lipoprotein NlpD